jgi:hypothetical protein
VNVWLNMEHWWNDTDWGNSKDSEERSLPLFHFSVTNHTWTALGSNLASAVRNQQLDGLSHGSAYTSFKSNLNVFLLDNIYIQI